MSGVVTTVADATAREFNELSMHLARRLVPAALLFRPATAARVVWTCATITIAGIGVCGVAAIPVVLCWSLLIPRIDPLSPAGMAAMSLLIVPSYVTFALLLMATTALLTRALHWYTPPNAELRIADLDWPVLCWARSMTLLHIVRLFAGPLFRGSPIWTAYLRLHGARIGRRVFINTTSINDYNLLEFGDDVVVGADVHISGHTVEHGLVKTGRVRLGNNVTVGLGSVIEIGVQAGANCQIGALSLVPKHAVLESGATYVGIPVRRLTPIERDR